MHSSPENGHCVIRKWGQVCIIVYLPSLQITIRVLSAAANSRRRASEMCTLAVVMETERAMCCERTRTCE